MRRNWRARLATANPEPGRIATFLLDRMPGVPYNLANPKGAGALLDPDANPQGWSVLSGVGDVLLHHRRTLRAGRPGHHLRSGHDPDLSPGAAAVLVHSHFAGGGGADHGYSGGRRLLPLDPGRFRRLLGLPGRVVELVGILLVGKQLRGFIQ